MARNKHDIEALITGVTSGDRGSLARCLRFVDDDPAFGRAVASRLHEHLRGARVLGITGNPGSGKSTVVDRVIENLRAAKKKVAVLAVDPSSPFSGGAILGDRVRMSRHFEDDGVYIRSLATRGALGGLSRSTFDSVRVLDAAGFDYVIVETVGVGQDEVDVVRLADTTVVLMIPGMGDDIQAIKAGLLEVADVFLINKSDREGAADLERGLRTMLSLVPHADNIWEPPIVRSIATKNEGIDELMKKIDRHATFLESEVGRQRLLSRQGEMFERLLDAALIDAGRAGLGNALEQARNSVRDGEDPYAAVTALVEAS